MSKRCYSVLAMVSSISLVVAILVRRFWLVQPFHLQKPFGHNLARATSVASAARNLRLICYGNLITAEGYSKGLGDRGFIRDEKSQSTTGSAVTQLTANAMCANAR